MSAPRSACLSHLQREACSTGIMPPGTVRSSQQVFIAYLLCARHYSQCWGHSGEQNSLNSCFPVPSPCCAFPHLPIQGPSSRTGTPEISVRWKRTWEGPSEPSCRLEVLMMLSCEDGAPGGQGPESDPRHLVLPRPEGYTEAQRSQGPCSGSCGI